MAKIWCISFPVEPSDEDLAHTLAGANPNNKEHIAYWIDSDEYEWEDWEHVGNLDSKEIVISSIHQLDQAKLLVNLGLDSTTIKGMLNA